MTSDDVSASYCMKVGAVLACIWAGVIGALLAAGVVDLVDLEKKPALAVLIGSLLVMCVAIPAARDPDFRHPKALLFSSRWGRSC